MGKEYSYVGLDIHKKTISYCVRLADGTIVTEGRLQAVRSALGAWASQLETPWVAGMEATMFTGWVYDALLEYGQEVKVGHPLMLRAIAAAKVKNDKVDARMLANLLRAHLFPRCYMAPQKMRDLRRVMRYRNLLVREATRMKNKTAGLLQEVGIEYEGRRLHGKRYFHELLDTLEEVPKSVIELLKMTRSNVELFTAAQQRLVTGLAQHRELRERVARLQTVPGVGIVTALTWALEIVDPHRFSSRKKAVSYCGLCSARDESSDKAKRGPLSKQRNKHLQTALIEAAKLAPCHHPHLAALYRRERERGANRNRATLTLARKLVAYLLHVDKTGHAFELPEAA